MEILVLYIYFDFLNKNKLSILSIIIDTVDKILYIIVKEVLMDNEGTKREGSPTQADIERGRRLKEFRKSLPGKYSQQKFSEAVGASQSMCSMYEAGILPPPVSMKKLMEQRFNLNVEWLETGEGSMFLDDIASSVNILFSNLNQENRKLVVEMMKKIYASQSKEEE